MYQKIFETVQHEFKDYGKTLEHLLEFLVIDSSPFLLSDIEKRMKWLFSNEELADKLLKAYDPKLLRSHNCDYIGELCLAHNDRFSIDWRSKVMSPRRVTSMLEKASIEKTQDPIRIIDPEAGTGRALLAIHEKAPNAHLFAIEKDLMAFRVAMTNCAIYGIKAYLLHADPSIHDININRPGGKYNWLFANRWDTCWQYLKPKYQR
jgi:methylase of polypeptide subunit release factors